MPFSASSSNCKGKIIANEQDALEVLVKIKPDHEYQYIGVELDRIENVFNSFKFVCKKCNCTLSLHTECMISNCITISHHEFDHSCEEIIMDKACK